MEINCPSYVNTALELLKKSGFKAYIVGGCVRDSIMGRTPNDWDMTTSALPEETLKVFSDFRTIPTGLKHGTVTVLIEKQPIEITTMRIDGEYSDSRRPDSVEFTDEITMDLSRRDFTVNAMAYNPDDGVVDPFGGKDDIERKIIRCVGEADRRFGEDALRIIRALRFASVLGFSIDKDTSDSIMRNHLHMQDVASERIRVELVKLLSGKGVEEILTDYKEVIFGIIPELKAEDRFPQNTPYHVFDVWTHTVKVVGAIRNEPVFRVAALLHDISKPECLRVDENGIAHFKTHEYYGAEKAKEIMKRLHFSNAEINRVYSIILLHNTRHDGIKTHIAHFCAQHSIANVRDSLELIRADAYGKNPEYLDIEIGRYEKALEQIDEIEKENLPMTVQELQINGNDLLAIGFRGKEIKDVLSALHDSVIEGRTANENAALKEAANKLKKV